MIELSSAKRVLAFFAHPDDEVLAAGGTLAKFARLGVETFTAIPGSGVDSRRRTQDPESRSRDLRQLRLDGQAAGGLLGIPPTHHFQGEFPDNEMDAGTLLELIHWLEGVLVKVRPDLLITHHRFCTNLDHRYCHEAAVVATRAHPGSHIPLLCGEVPSSTGYLRPAQWEPNLYVELAAADLDQKILAMAAYEGECRPDPHPRSEEVLRALAKVRGSEAGFLWAESFMIQKAYA